jgi:FAD/FMN-containing dehydrogenase
MALAASQLAELRALLGDSGVMSSEAALFTYEADALTMERRPPDVVVLPRSTDEVCALVRWARDKGLPVTPRGAGTGLAGGATTEQGGLSLSLNRMDQVLRVDESRLFAWVQPGLVNLWLSQQLASKRLYFAPDPAGLHHRRQRRHERRRTALLEVRRHVQSRAGRRGGARRWQFGDARR